MIYKIKGVGVDTTNLDYTPLKVKTEKDNLRYIFTNPAANNDFLLNEYIGYQLPDTVLVTEVNYVDGVDDTLTSHLKRLGRNSYKLLFMNANLDYRSFDLSIQTIKKLGIVENFGLSRPKDLDTLKKNVEYLREIDCNIGSVLLDISPLHFQKDIIDYCEQNSILIFATNPFAGWANSRIAIGKFSVPYLLNFASVYADVVLLSGRDMYLMSEDLAYLNSITGQQVENSEIYELNENVDLLVEVNKVISTALRIDKMLLPYNSPEYLFNFDETKFSKFNILPEIKQDEKTKTELEIDELVGVIYKAPEQGDDDYYTSLRYKIEDYLDISHPGWEKTIIKVTDKIIYIKFTNRVIKKKWYGKLYETVEGDDQYLLFFSDGIFKFKEIQKKGGEIV